MHNALLFMWKRAKIKNIYTFYKYFHIYPQNIFRRQMNKR